MTQRPPAGWYPDPQDPSRERWWDGASWGAQTRSQSFAPPPPPAAAAAPWPTWTPQQPSYTTAASHLDPAPALSFIEAAKDFLRRYADFKGRTSRSGYWYAALFSLLVGLTLRFVDIALFASDSGSGSDKAAVAVLSGIWQLATIIPHFAVLTRRLRDVGRRPRYLWLIIVPFGVIAIIVFCCQKGRYGEAAK